MMLLMQTIVNEEGQRRTIKEHHTGVDNRLQLDDNNLYHRKRKTEQYGEAGTNSVHVRKESF